MKHVPLHDLLALSDSGVWGDEDNENGVSVLRSTNFNRDGTLNFKKPSFRDIDLKKRDAKLLSVGDILLEKSGGGPQQPVGRVCLFQGSELPQSFGNFIARLRPTDEVLSEYLFYYLWQFHALGKTSHYQKQTTGIRNLETKRYLAIEVPVPPLAEQSRIVDILSRAESIVKLRREAEKKAAELIPALFLDMFGDPTTNPKGWPVSYLGEHVDIASAVRTPDLNHDADLPCIGADSIEGHTGKLVSLPIVRDVQPISGKYRFKLGDVLYSKIRPYLAKASLAPCVGYCSADMYPLSCKPSLRTNFLLELLLSKSFTDYATAESVRAQMPKLNRQTLFAYKFPVPPTEIQEQFSDRANAAYSIQSQQAAATAMAQDTFDALLSQVFAV